MLSSAETADFAVRQDPYEVAARSAESEPDEPDERLLRGLARMHERELPAPVPPAVLDGAPESHLPALRLAAGGLVESPALTARAAERLLASRLTQLRLPSYRTTDEGSLRAALEPLKALTGLPIVVTPAAENALRDQGVVLDLELPNPISPRNLLNLITELAGDDPRARSGGPPTPGLACCSACPVSHGRR